MNPRKLLLLAVLVCLATGCGKQEPLTANRATGKAPEFYSPQKRTSLLERATTSTKSRDNSGAAFGETSAQSGVAVNAAGSGVMSLGDVDLGATGLTGRSTEGLAMAAGDEQVAALDMRQIEVNSVSTDYKQKFDLGQQYLTRGDIAQALICFQDAQALDKESFAAYVGEATCYLQLQDYGRALAAIEFAIRLSPNNLPLYSHRALIRYRRKDYQGALDDFTRIIIANPKDFANLMNRAQVYVQMNNLKGATADYTSILKDNPTAVDCLLNRGIMYFRQGRWNDAIQDADAVIKLQPVTRDAHFLKSLSFARMGKPELGRSAFDEAVRLGLDKGIADSWERTFYPNGKPPGG